MGERPPIRGLQRPIPLLLLYHHHPQVPSLRLAPLQPLPIRSHVCSSYRSALLLASHLASVPPQVAEHTSGCPPPCFVDSKQDNRRHEDCYRRNGAALVVRTLSHRICKDTLYLLQQPCSALAQAAWSQDGWSRPYVPHCRARVLPRLYISLRAGRQAGHKRGGRLCPESVLVTRCDISCFHRMFSKRWPSWCTPVSRAPANVSCSPTTAPAGVSSVSRLHTPACRFVSLTCMLRPLAPRAASSYSCLLLSGHLTILPVSVLVLLPITVSSNLLYYM
ncbi:hypothetical protein C8Q76DRAFT_271453 [Earliella scabrosa]|nr:hypothetical protein C8Q76DRAFT_271453 [Earliella scabrosa]